MKLKIIKNLAILLALIAFIAFIGLGTGIASHAFENDNEIAIRKADKYEIVRN